jgi:hypothetical protein
MPLANPPAVSDLLSGPRDASLRGDPIFARADDLTVESHSIAPRILYLGSIEPVADVVSGASGRDRTRRARLVALMAAVARTAIQARLQILGGRGSVT